MNPRPLSRRRRRAISRVARRRLKARRRGPKHLGNLPAPLRRYWQRVRATSRRLINPRGSAPMAKKQRRRRRSRAHAHHALTPHQRRSRAAKKAARTRLRRYGHTGRRRKAVGGDFGINPRYRRIRNPRRLGSLAAGFSRSGITKLATGAGVGALGAVGMDYLWQWGSGYLPANFQTGYVGTAVKAAAAVAAGWGASKLVGRSAAVGLVLGSFTVIAYQLVHQIIAQASPSIAIPSTTTTSTPTVSGLSAYQQPVLGWTSPGTVLRGLGRNQTKGHMRFSAYGPAPGQQVNRPGGSVSPSGLAMAGTY